VSGRLSSCFGSPAACIEIFLIQTSRAVVPGFRSELKSASLFGPDANESAPAKDERRENPLVDNALDLAAELLYGRMRRAVDLLWRETVIRKRERFDERERRRSVRRMKNLQRIVRRALADYHRIEIERRDAPPLEGTRSRPL
jgi:hypothetical protein